VIIVLKNERSEAFADLGTPRVLLATSVVLSIIFKMKHCGRNFHMRKYANAAYLNISMQTLYFYALFCFYFSVVGCGSDLTKDALGLVVQ